MNRVCQWPLLLAAVFAIFAILMSHVESRSVRIEDSIPEEVRNSQRLLSMFSRSQSDFMPSSEAAIGDIRRQRTLGSFVVGNQYGAKTKDGTLDMPIRAIEYPPFRPQPYYSHNKRAYSSSRSPTTVAKRGSTLNEVIRRLMAMQGHNYSGGRATRMRFGAGGKRK